MVMGTGNKPRVSLTSTLLNIIQFIDHIPRGTLQFDIWTSDINGLCTTTLWITVKEQVHTPVPLVCSFSLRMGSTDSLIVKISSNE